MLCCAEIDEAHALRAELGDEAVVGGERNGIVIEGFDVGASPREFAQAPRARTLILSTTNGTRAILTAAARCEVVLLGSLLNLSALVRTAHEDGGDVAILCSGFKGAFALDDAYCAGRIVEALGGERSDAAIGAAVIADAWPDRARRTERAHVRPAGARGGHRVLRAGRLARHRAALLAHDWDGGGDHDWRSKTMSEAETLFGEEHVRRYRETGGEVGHIWREGSTVLLLTTTGRKSGEPRTTPLIYARTATAT